MLGNSRATRAFRRGNPEPESANRNSQDNGNVRMVVEIPLPRRTQTQVSNPILQSAGPSPVNTAANPKEAEDDEDGVVIDWDRAGGVEAVQKLSEYEIERIRRLEENKKQLQALGIYRDANEETAPKPRAKAAPKPKKPKLTDDNLPRRQSGRLQGKPQEFKGLKYLDKNVQNDDLIIAGVANSDESDSEDSGHEEEVEFDENGKPIIVLPMKFAPKNTGGGQNNGKHMKYERGGRIYDSVNGTSCHQCRQKTLDPKVKCTNIITYRAPDGTETKSQCTLMMDNLCLEGRYGESVDVERAKGTWVCPKCRGICNCSFCMAKRGKQPTGQLKNTAIQLGYKSVSDMLAATGKLGVKRKEPGKDSRVAPEAPVEAPIVPKKEGFNKNFEIEKKVRFSNRFFQVALAMISYYFLGQIAGALADTHPGLYQTS
ncbi:hypothetical protein HDU99_006918 [Rhizoclosmatium hyalinum]|nr:hypothetical protein HDU99_006918 [Rhizoclosmatium hyalinum]